MNLLFRLIKTLFFSYFGKRIGFDEMGKISFLCWPNDLDFNFHMNNGRYMTLLDLGRFDFMVRTGLFKKTLQHGWMPVLAGARVEYRKPIHLWEKFEIQTHFLGCDEKRFYIEQYMVNQKKELLFKAVVKAAFVKHRKSVPVKEIFKSLGLAEFSKTLPEEVKF